MSILCRARFHDNLSCNANPLSPMRGDCSSSRYLTLRSLWAERSFNFQRMESYSIIILAVS